MEALRVFSSEEMKQYDAWVGSEFKMPETILVEHAGRECVRALMKISDLSSMKSTLFLCGDGGNGADGLVMARLLKCFATHHEAPITIDIILTKYLNEQRELNRLLIDQISALGIEVQFLEDLKPKELSKIISTSNIIVDAILGTGVSGDLSPVIFSLLGDIKQYRSQNSTLIAIDIPSGLIANWDVMQDDPYVAGSADFTFVIQGLKMSNLAPGSERYCGKEIVLDIGMPRFLEEKTTEPKHLISIDMVQSYLEQHTNGPLVHKGQRGHVLVIGGSEKMSGATMLASHAAFKAGAGKVTTTLPEKNAITDETVMSIPLPTVGGSYSENSLCLIQEAIKGKQALVLGPGLGLSDNVLNLLKALLLDITKSGLPCVLDADALTLVSRIKQKEDIVLADNFVLTPHVGEFLRLEEAYFKDSLLVVSRYQAVERLAHATRANILLKGPKSLFFDLKSGAFYNPHQSASLAVAGSGDVLSGLMGGFFARGYGVKEGAIIATFLHGHVGEMLDMDFVDGVGVNAKTILEGIPRAYREVLLS